ncbi:unnamed protein product [Arctogadus glacialis]
MDQQLMTLMELRLNLLQDDIAERFRVSVHIGHITLLWRILSGRRPRSPSPEAPLSPGPVLFLGMNRGSTCNGRKLKSPSEFPNRQQHSQAVHSHRVGLLDFSGYDCD